MIANRAFKDANQTSGTGSFPAVVFAADLDKIADHFREWRAQKNEPPIQMIVDSVIGPLGFDQRQKNIISTAAKLAAEPNSNPFHNNRHFLEVFTITAMLGHNARQEGRLDQNTYALMLTAALVHDYKHDGGINGTQQYRLENMAFDNAGPHLIDAGATNREMAMVRSMILTTDVSRNFASPVSKSPADTVKQYSRSGNPDDLQADVKALHNLQIADAAMMVQDADVGSSMICSKLCRQSSEYLAQEQGRPFDPKSQTFFYDQICRRTMGSVSGKALLQPCLDRLMLEAETATKRQPEPTSP